MGELERHKKERAYTVSVWMKDLSWRERAILIREHNEYFKYSTHRELLSLVRGNTYTGPSYLLALD